jgi:hypothetical protein
VKAGTFKVLSVTPGGGAIHHLLQDRVTRTTAVTDDKVLHKLHLGASYLAAVAARFPDLSRVRHADVGTGWMPTIPLLFHAAGIENQTLCDVDRHLAPSTVAELVPALDRLIAADPALAGLAPRLVPAPGPEEPLDNYLEKTGMRYVAPYTLDDLGTGRFEVVTCTGVLPHITTETLRPLLRAVTRSLVEGGLFIAYVPLHDVYARFDPSITPYNKWRYRSFVWELLNSRLMSFNRLTASGYRRLLEEAGLEIVSFALAPPTAEDLEALDRVTLHPEFASTPRAELASSSLVVVARRP